MVYTRQELYKRSQPLPALLGGSLYTSLFVIITLVTSLFLLSVAIQRLKTIRKSQPQSDLWTQLSNMEKATSKSSSTSSSTFSPPPPPSVSACDVLKPLSQNGNFPSSGAVAARAREQMENSGNNSPSTAATVATQPRSGSEGDAATGSVQRRNESVQQMREVDVNGVRTWRRLVVEYS